MAAFTTIAAGLSLAITAGTTTNSFVQAGKQKKAQRRAEREASKKMDSARKSLEKNYMESLSIPLEAYEREMEAINVQTAQATQAAAEGSQRGVAATAGQVQQVASEAQAQQRTKMAEDLFNLEAATAEEASRLRDIGVNLDLAEAEGAQMAAADAARARSQAIQQGIEGVASTAQQGLKGVLNIIKNENPGMVIAVIGETFTPSGQTREATVLESMCAAAVKTESIMTEYTCAFVTIVNNPKLRMTLQMAEGLRTSLGRALAILNGSRQTNIFKKEVEEIQVTLNDAVKANK